MPAIFSFPSLEDLFKDSSFPSLVSPFPITRHLYKCCGCFESSLCYVPNFHCTCDEKGMCPKHDELMKFNCAHCDSNEFRYGVTLVEHVETSYDCCDEQEEIVEVKCERCLTFHQVEVSQLDKFICDECFVETSEKQDYSYYLPKVCNVGSD
jgi:hypothetical protein